MDALLLPSKPELDYDKAVASLVKAEAILKDHPFTGRVFEGYGMFANIRLITLPLLCSITFERELHRKVDRHHDQ